MADTESLSDKLEPELNVGDLKRVNSRVGTDLTQSQAESLKKQVALVRGTEQNIVAAASAQDSYADRRYFIGAQDRGGDRKLANIPAAIWN